MTQEELKQRLIELIASKVCDAYSPTCDEWQPHDCGKCYANNCHIADIADHLIANGVTILDRGEWETQKYPLTQCSECYRVRDFVHDHGWNFCPNCGADMRGVTETEKGGAE